MPELFYKDFTVSFEDTPEIHKKVFDRVLKFYQDHRAFHEDTVSQDENCQIDANDVFVDIAHNIIKFQVKDSD
jgi:hypothetical protein